MLQRVFGSNVSRMYAKRCASSGTGVANVFDRNAKRQQRDRAAVSAESRDFDYLKADVAETLADRILDIKDHSFARVLDLGSGPGHLLPHLPSGVGKDRLTMMDISEKMLHRDADLDVQRNREPERIASDEETLNFDDHSFDLIISNLSLHWINDLPGIFAQATRVLKPDGFFLASMFAEDTLFELRSCLLLAEQERRGGMGQHISPYAGVGDIGNLLTRTKMALPTVDTERIVIRYGDIFALMRDLQGMAESNCTWRRAHTIPKETLIAANAIYHELFPGTNPDTGEKEGIEASFNVAYIGGWSPGPNQQQPARRGSQSKSLADI